MPERAHVPHEQGRDVLFTDIGRSLPTLLSEVVVYVRSLAYAALRRMTQTLHLSS